MPSPLTPNPQVASIPAIPRGVRLDTNARDDTEKVLSLQPGLSGVSILAAGPSLTDRLRLYYTAGLSIHLVVAGETYARYGLDPENIQDILTCHQRLYQEIHGTRYIASLENGNEPDVPAPKIGEPFSSSFSRTPELLQADIWAAERVWHSQGHSLAGLPDGSLPPGDTAIPLWVGGSGTGQPSYYAQLPDYGCHGIALHSYDSRLGDWAPPQLADENRNLAYLLAAFEPLILKTRRRRTRLTEIGLTSTDEAFQAWYIVQLDRYVNSDSRAARLCESWDWFNFSDLQVPPFGLTRGDFSLKPSYIVMQGLPSHTLSSEPTHTDSPSTLTRGDTPMPTPPPPPTPAASAPSPSIVAWRNRWRSVRPQALYNHEFGLETAWRAAGGSWGYPLNDLEENVLIDDVSRSSRTFSTAGLVYWDGAQAIVLGWPQ